jgi:hypothetical protein
MGAEYMKKILVAALVLVAVALGLGGYLFSNLDALAGRAIEEIGGRILGVPVKVAKVSLSPADGAGALEGFQIGNPAGFQLPHALQAGRIELVVEPKSLTENVIHVRKIEMRGIAVNYESGDGGTNFDAIKRNAEQFAGDKKTESPPKKLIVDSLVISGARMTYAGTATLGKPVELTLPDIALRDIGKKQGGIPPDQFAKAVLDAMTRNMGQAVAGSVKDAGKSIGESVKGFFAK